MVKKEVKLLSKNRSHELLVPIGIVLHETATPGATAENEFSYFNTGNRGASAHGFVDWNGYIQTIPYDEVAWHAGYTANHKYIGIEMCHATNKADFDKVWDNTVEIVVDLINKCGFLINELTTHNEVSLRWGETDHTDPIGYFKKFGKTFEDFKNDVIAQINGGLNMTQYKELKDEIEKIREQLSTYKYMDESIKKISPDAFEALQAAIKKGAIAYGENGFTPGLTKDMIRMIIYMYRAEVFN